VKQGDIYRVNLDPVIGHEIGGENLVAIVSENRINNSFLPVVIVPLVNAAGVPPHVSACGLTPPSLGWASILWRTACKSGRWIRAASPARRKACFRTPR